MNEEKNEIKGSDIRSPETPRPTGSMQPSVPRVRISPLTACSPTAPRKQGPQHPIGRNLYLNNNIKQKNVSFFKFWYTYPSVFKLLAVMCLRYLLQFIHYMAGSNLERPRLTSRQCHWITTVVVIQSAVNSLYLNIYSVRNI